MDWKAAVLYLALTATREECQQDRIAHLIPRRLTNRGRKPTVRSPLVSGPLSREERRDPDLGSGGDLDDWDLEEELEVGQRLDTEKDRERPGNINQRRVLGKVIEVAVRTTFKNHIYMYRNYLYQQLKGGAIGLRLTGIVARIVMDRWSKIFRTTLDHNAINIYLQEKYVDDINVVIERISKG